MSRAQRLLDVIQLLRSHRGPVAADRLADELGVSMRTIYPYIETLKGQGAHIDGEAGIGYVLRPGFMLPPLMFSEEEIEALVLVDGLRRSRMSRSESGAERACEDRRRAARRPNRQLR
nr:HTH domain-containing protein [Bradyrhizobium manausense]